MSARIQIRKALGELFQIPHRRILAATHHAATQKSVRSKNKTQKTTHKVENAINIAFALSLFNTKHDNSRQIASFFANIHHKTTKSIG
jgi:hypothetical protein